MRSYDERAIPANRGRYTGELGPHEPIRSDICSQTSIHSPPNNRGPFVEPERKSPEVWEAPGANMLPPCTDTYLSIWESEICAIAADSVFWGSTETLGEMYGLFTRAMRFAVLYVTGPSAEAAEHGFAHASQDLAQFHKNGEVLWRHYGLQYLGNHHSHHSLGLGGPSGEDTRNIVNLARRNSLPQVAQLIVTHERALGRAASHVGDAEGLDELGSEEACVSRHRNRPFRPKRLLEDQVQVRVRAFLCSRIPSDECQEMAIHVRRGISPHRPAIDADKSVEAAQLSKLTRTFPLSRIVWTPREASSPLSEPVNDWLAGQCGRLPDEVQDALSVMAADDKVLLQMPLFSGYQLAVLYDTREAICIRNVTLRHADNAGDVTEEIMGLKRILDLGELYQRAWNHLAHQVPEHCGASSGCTRAASEATDAEAAEKGEDNE